MSRNDSNPLAVAYSLTQQLKRKGRVQRDRLMRLSTASAPLRALRNDPLPLLELEYLSIDQMQAPSRAVRSCDSAHVCEVANVIHTLGFCAPILIGKNNVILDGVVRLEAAKLAGLDRVPCVRIEHLSDAEQRVLRLAVNRLGEKGQWNLPELKIEFEELIIAEAPIEISGFAVDEVDHILIGDEAKAIEHGPLAPEPDAVAVARLGDVFQLGPHRIICGSATDASVLARLMEGDDGPVRLILTDEPYNVPISGHVTGGKHREFVMASGEMTDAEFLDFNVDFMKAALPYLCEGGVFGGFIDWRGAPTVNAAAAELGLTPLNLIVWVKTNAGMGSLYRSQHELLPLFKKGAASHVNNINLGKHGRWRSNVWTYPGASSLGSDARRGLRDHPTVKPTVMLQDALLDITNRGDAVLDPFLGSGSTLIAADKTGRVCRGVELDPRYVDVIIRRYEGVTRKKAILVKTGETFVALSARRANSEDAITDNAPPFAKPHPGDLDDTSVEDSVNDSPDDGGSLDSKEAEMRTNSTSRAAEDERARLASSPEGDSPVATENLVAASDENEVVADASDQDIEDAVSREMDQEPEAPTGLANEHDSDTRARDVRARDVLGASLICGVGGPQYKLSGVCLVDMAPDGAAAKMGLEDGDFVSKVDDEDVKAPWHVVREIAAARNAGREKVFLEVYSKGKLWDAEFWL
jgi:DNA modification methylase